MMYQVWSVRDRGRETTMDNCEFWSMDLGLAADMYQKIWAEMSSPTVSVELREVRH